jgi:hypothetical protein
MKLRSYVTIWYVGLLAGCGGKIGSIKGSAPMIMLLLVPVVLGRIQGVMTALMTSRAATLAKASPA